MFFFEYNHQAVLSINDSLYFGRYFKRKDQVRIFFNPPAEGNIQLIQGRISNEGSITGKINDSVPIMMDLNQLEVRKDYLNTVYDD